jgi:hypothetical protein
MTLPFLNGPMQPIFNMLHIQNASVVDDWALGVTRPLGMWRMTVAAGGRPSSHACRRMGESIWPLQMSCGVRGVTRDF